MLQAKDTRKNPDRAIVLRFAPAAREALFWLTGALAVVLAVALGSFNPNDPSFTNSTGSPVIHNLIGPVGAWTSDLLLFTLGLSAYALPILVAYGGWLGFRGLNERPAFVRVTRVVAMLIALVALSTVIALLAAPVPDWLPGGGGGIIGNAVATPIVDGVGVTGASLVSLAVFLATVTLAFGLSWLALMDKLGGGLVRVWDWLMVRRQHLGERNAMQAGIALRAKALEREVKRRETRPKPRIEPAISTVEIGPRAEREQQRILFAQPAVAGTLPPLELLNPSPEHSKGYSAEALAAMSRLVELKLRDFGVEVEVVAVHAGPVITRFELQPAPGVKVSQISNLAKDLARALSTVSVRVVEVIPGKTVIGLEVPNEVRELVTLGEVIRSEAYERAHSKLTLALGRDISGQPVVTDLGRMPHLLIAGTTGSGKSVAINAMILSLLYKSGPEDVRLVLVDPKMLELSAYEGIPHLLTPVITDMGDAANALRWCCIEMDHRYRRLAAAGARNLTGFNRRVRELAEKGDGIPDPLVEPDEGGTRPVMQTMPYLVVVVDELADLMIVVGKKAEELIARLAQKARAAGIHLVVATQRPSVDVITGLIKANIPARIAFQVSARVDSRTIIDQGGAEALLGSGDMLFLPPGTSMVARVHGAFVDEVEVHRVVSWLRQSAQPAYVDDVLAGGAEGGPGAIAGDASEEDDPLYDEAVRIVTETRRASVSAVQRRLRIGYNRAARLVEHMESVGIVGPLQPNGSREVLAPPPPE